MKKQSNLQRLLNYAEKRKALAYLSWVLIYIAGLIALAYVGISHCNKFANRNDRAYFHASHGEDRGIWER